MTTFETLNEEAVRELRRPFATLAVKFLPVGKVNKRGEMGFLTYIDGSLVIERLSEVDPAWSITAPRWSEIDTGLKCEVDLTVLGVTRTGVGQLTVTTDYSTKLPKAPKLDDKHFKQAHSDALKRAALMFSVGAYLRNMGDMFMLPEDPQGAKYWWGYDDTYQGKVQRKLGGLNVAGKKQLRARYNAIVTHPEFVKRYGEPTEYGDVEQDDVDDVPEVEPEGGVTDPQMDVLVTLSRFTGRNTSAEYVRATYEGKTFERSLASLLTSVKANMGVSVDDAERLRKLAQASAGGDASALVELGDGLEQLQALAEAEKGDDEQEAMPV